MLRIVQRGANFFIWVTGWIRTGLYSIAMPIGPGTVIFKGFAVRNPSGIRIGKRCFIHMDCFFQGSGGIVIGDDVSFGPHVMIFSENHRYENKKKKISEQGIEKKNVTIGTDVWIGANVVILAGVTIGNGSVVGAGAVVTKSFPPYSVIGGVPAKLLRTR